MAGAGRTGSTLTAALSVMMLNLSTEFIKFLQFLEKDGVLVQEMKWSWSSS
jgi:hypothetical protein